MTVKRSRRRRRGKDPLSYPPDIPKEWQKQENGDYAESLVTSVTFVRFDKIAELATHAPLQAAHEVQGACTILEAGYQNHLRKCLGAVYTVAYYLILNNYELERFFKLPLWNKMKRRPSTNAGRNHTLRFVLKYAFSTSATTANTLSRYYVGLQKMFNKGIKPEKVREDIMKKGPEKLYEEAKARKTVKKTVDFSDLDSIEERDLTVQQDNNVTEELSGESKAKEFLQNSLMDATRSMLDGVVKLSKIYNKIEKV